MKCVVNGLGRGQGVSGSLLLFLFRECGCYVLTKRGCTRLIIHAKRSTP